MLLQNITCLHNPNVVLMFSAALIFLSHWLSPLSSLKAVIVDHLIRRQFFGSSSAIRMVGKPWCQILVPSGSIVVAAFCETGLLLHRGLVCEGRAQETGLAPVPPSSLKQAGLGPEHHRERKLSSRIGYLPAARGQPSSRPRGLPSPGALHPSPHRSCSL